MQQICEKVVKDLSQLQPTSKEYQDKILNLALVCRDLYPQEMKEFLNVNGLTSYVTIWDEKSKELIESVDSFGIDLKTKQISIQMGEDKIEAPLLDVKSFLINNLNLLDNSWEYFLGLSYMIQPDRFEQFQLIQSLILSSDS